MRATLKTINQELARRGHNALLAKGDGYFYFWSGQAADWLDRTVRVDTLNSLSLEQWIEEFEKLKQKNQQIFAGPGKTRKSPAGGKAAAPGKAPDRQPGKPVTAPNRR
jgi:hypothetical protein